MSNLVKCKTCGKDVSRNAQTCIHCGEPLFSDEIIERNQDLEENYANNMFILTSVVVVSAIAWFIYVYFVGGFIAEDLELGNFWGLMISGTTGMPLFFWLNAHLTEIFKP